ncbi:cytochrome c3 family protein [Malonomonas rubra]|uniref:cytochrome c3 family protein n=1 Tax=Malonomonas rubra TaxID=57040 RepID=UPI0026EA51F3|nr:cytochrome c3 family protein [Malonomonas rubra]
MFVDSKWHMKSLLILLSGLFLTLPAYAMDAPESVTIDALAKYYEPVEFDHEMHVDVSEDCSSCHHHTTGTGTADQYCSKCHSEYKELVKVACQDCHPTQPFSAEVVNLQSQQDIFHADMNGLVGAYHQNCMGCHQEVGGPTGCEDCHARTEAGDEFYHAGKYAPTTAEHATAGH